MSQEVKFLYLTEEEMVQAGVTDALQCVDTIEETFHLVSRGDYLMGGETENEHGIMVCFPQEQRFPGMPVAGPDRRFMALVAYLGGRFHCCGEKWYGSNIANVPKGLPRSIHIVFINDVETGAPLCLMCGNLISSMRTGAVPGVAARHLAGNKAKVLGIVGGGVINRAAIKCIAAACPSLEQVKIYDIIKEKGEAFAAAMSAEIGKPVYAVDSLEECVRDSDITHFASAGKVRPHVRKEWVKPGSLVETSSFTDLDKELLQTSNIVWDKYKMHDIWYKTVPSLDLPTYEFFRMAERGEFDLSTLMDLGDILEGQYPASRYDNGNTTIFMAEGMPVWDVAWAYQVYQNALKLGLGTDLQLWKTPYWA